jgi:hypothetical protein
MAITVTYSNRQVEDFSGNFDSLDVIKGVAVLSQKDGLQHVATAAHRKQTHYKESL